MHTNVALRMENARGRTVGRLLMLTALPLALVLARLAYTGQPTFADMMWNLFLAWLPVAFAALALRPRPMPALVRLGLALAWLLFLPNAPYLITDLMHLYHREVPILYDVALLFSCAVCGLALGLVSLRWMEAAVARRLGRWAGRAFGLAALAAAGFGIYVGRYLRWNSWDVLVRPGMLAHDLWLHVRHPIQHWEGWALAMLFAGLLFFIYSLWPHPNSTSPA